MVIVLASMALYGFELMQVALVLTLYANVVALAWGVNFAFNPGKVLAVLTIEVFSHQFNHSKPTTTQAISKPINTPVTNVNIFSLHSAMLMPPVNPATCPVDRHTAPCSLVVALGASVMALPY
jgi:hypothetical protein